MNDSKSKKNKTAIILWVIVAALVIGCAAWWFLFPHGSTTDVTAEIWVDGEAVLALYLPETEDKTISLAEYGHDMTVTVRDHKICVSHSDCPDQVCVGAGWLAKDGDRAVCMPNRVTVMLTHGESVPVTLD